MTTRGRPRHPELLTPRQQEVWHLLRQGLTNEEIAARLGISLDGAKYHVSEVLRRLGVDNRYEAAELAPEAVAATRARWAWAAAPLLFAKKLHFSALTYAATGAALGAVAVGIALLAWGVTTSNNTDHAATANATSTPIPHTGIPELDHVIDLLVHQDVDGLTALAELAPVRCSTMQTIGSPPACPPGAAEGTPVDAFNMAQCEGFYLTTREQIRQSFGATLARQPSAAIYAVLRDTIPDHPTPSYTIAVTPDRPSQATADVSFWQVRAFDGAITYLQQECGPGGAAQQLAYRYPKPDLILGPYNNCLVPPGDTANYLVTVEGLSPGGIKPQFWGPAKTTLGTDTGARAIVTVPADTTWTTGPGGPTRLEDVRPGMELEAVGPMGDDCVITAQTILAPLPPPDNATGCPVNDALLCDFAVQLQFALNSSEFDFLSQRLAPATHPCRDTIYDAADDVGCPTTDGTSAPVVTLLHFSSDCCAVRPEDFRERLREWVDAQTVSAPWKLYAVVRSAALWQGEPAVIVVRGDTPDAPTIVVGTARRDAALDVPGVAVGPRSFLFVSPDEPLLRWSTPQASGTTHYRNDTFHVEFDMPSNWIVDPNYGLTAGGVSTSYASPTGRADGFVLVDALASPSVDDAVQATAYHKLKPYGDAPVIRDITLPAGTGKLILPDPNPSPSEMNEATLIIPYPADLDVAALGPGPYPYFELHARPQDIEQIAQTVRFITPAASPTPSP